MHELSPSEDAAEPAPAASKIDLSDIAVGTGVVLLSAGAAAFHIGAGVMVLGASLILIGARSSLGA